MGVDVCSVFGKSCADLVMVFRGCQEESRLFVVVDSVEISPVFDQSLDNLFVIVVRGKHQRRPSLR